MAEGYYAMQFAGVGTDYPVLNEIREMYKKQGKPAPKEMASTVFYNRGVLVAAIHVEAIRNALKAKPDGKITGADVKDGFEKITNFSLGGLVPPLKITPTGPRGRRAGADLAGEGRQVREGDRWFAAYPDVRREAHQGRGQVVADADGPVRMEPRAGLSVGDTRRAGSAGRATDPGPSARRRYRGRLR